MKSPGVIYRKYRQLKRKILYEKLQEARKKLSKNCLKYTEEVCWEKIAEKHWKLYKSFMETK